MADKPKRAWRIVHSESSTGWGGQEHRVLDELAGFQQRGSQVWLLAPVESQIFRRAEETNVPAASLPGAKWRFPFAVLGTARWLRRLKPDVINTHSSRDGWVAGLAARLAGVPFIIRTRHIDVDYPNRWLSRHAFTTLADHVLTTSDRITRASSTAIAIASAYSRTMDFRRRFGSTASGWSAGGASISIFRSSIVNS